MKLVLFLFILTTFLSAFAADDKNRSNNNCEFPKELLSECGHVFEETSSIDLQQLKKLYPWHVAIYRQRNSNVKPINTCAGVLISKNVLLTAAHCLADDANGALRNIAEYFITAGNDYREFDDERDSELRQVRRIKKVVLPQIYRGHGSDFKGDIAIVVVDKPFVMSNVVQPACIGGTSNYQLPENAVGLSTGWGLTTASRDPNTRLSKLSVPLMHLDQCRISVSNEFSKYLNSNEKICGVFKDGSSICASDNGGGFMYPETNNAGEKRLYVHGITSVGLISGGSCDTVQYGSFTTVKSYLPEICQVINNTQ